MCVFVCICTVFVCVCLSYGQIANRVSKVKSQIFYEMI